MTKLIRVRSHSRPAPVAGAIAGMLRDGGAVDVQAVGARAVNQAVKAAALAQGFMQDEGREFVMVPGFTEVRIGGKMRSAVRFSIRVD